MGAVIPKGLELVLSWGARVWLSGLARVAPSYACDLLEIAVIQICSPPMRDNSSWYIFSGAILVSWDFVSSVSSWLTSLLTTPPNLYPCLLQVEVPIARSDSSATTRPTWVTPPSIRALAMASCSAWAQLLPLVSCSSD